MLHRSDQSWNISRGSAAQLYCLSMVGRLQTTQHQTNQKTYATQLISDKFCRLSVKDGHKLYLMYSELPYPQCMCVGIAEQYPIIIINPSCQVKKACEEFIHRSSLKIFFSVTPLFVCFHVFNCKSSVALLCKAWWCHRVCEDICYADR